MHKKDDCLIKKTHMSIPTIATTPLPSSLEALPGFINTNCQSLSLESVEQLRKLGQQLGLPDYETATKEHLCRTLSERFRTGLDPNTIRGRSLTEYEFAAAAAPPVVGSTVQSISTTVTSPTPSTTPGTLTQEQILQQLRDSNQRIRTLRDALEASTSNEEKEELRRQLQEARLASQQLHRRLQQSLVTATAQLPKMPTTSVLDQILTKYPDLRDPISHTLMIHPVRVPLRTAAGTITHYTYGYEKLREFMEGSPQSRRHDPMTRQEIADYHVYADVDKWQQISTILRQLGLDHGDPNPEGYELPRPVPFSDQDVIMEEDVVDEQTLLEYFRQLRDFIEALRRGDHDAYLAQTRTAASPLLSLNVLIADFGLTDVVETLVNQYGDPFSVLPDYQDLHEAFYGRVELLALQRIQQGEADRFLIPLTRQWLLPEISPRDVSNQVIHLSPEYEDVIKKLNEQWRWDPNINVESHAVRRTISARAQRLLLNHLSTTVQSMVEHLDTGRYNDSFFMPRIPLGTATIPQLLFYYNIATLYHLLAQFNRPLVEQFEESFYDRWTKAFSLLLSQNERALVPVAKSIVYTLVYDTLMEVQNLREMPDASANFEHPRYQQNKATILMRVGATQFPPHVQEKISEAFDIDMSEWYYTLSAQVIEAIKRVQRDRGISDQSLEDNIRNRAYRSAILSEAIQYLGYSVPPLQ